MKLTIIASFILFLALSVAGQKSPAPKTVAERIAAAQAESFDRIAEEFIRSGFEPGSDRVKGVRAQAESFRAAGADPQVLIDRLLDLAAEARLDTRADILLQVQVVQNDILIRLLRSRGTP